MGTGILNSPAVENSALTPEVLAAMPEEERRLWNDIGELATREILSNKRECAQPSYVPSGRLKELLLKAKNQYNGMRYCQMQKLAKIFEF